MRYFASVLVIILSNIWTVSFAEEQTDYSDTLQALLSDEDLSLTEVKLTIDTLVDPKMDRKTTQAAIRGLAAQANLLAGS